MCGIAGSYGNIDDTFINYMLRSQNYRGPDGFQIYISPDKKMGLGHVRLAIVDVFKGQQPITNTNESVTIAVNGEIYNYKKLRRHLKKNHNFSTNSDSEVILHLYEEYGIDLVKYLRGMFAIAIFDQRIGLILIRDPIGIKPLYYGFDNQNTLYFASEIKCLLPYVKKIKELPNGAYLINGKNLERYYKIPKPKSRINEIHEAVSALDTALNNAIKKRLMSDVPLGVFLSGGLDSSLIAAIAKIQKEGELHSFSVGFEGSEDLKNAKAASKYIGTVHHEEIVSESQIIASLPIVIQHLESYDPALVRSAIPTYFVSKLASQYVKVVLSGEGADELFAGYHYLDTYKSKLSELSNELFEITKSLHNSNLQRVDRMTMAHSLEGRVPFLDIEIVDLAFNINPNLKIKEDFKWVLRKVAEKYLPKSIAWRVKEKFAIGSGIAHFLQNYAEKSITNDELREYTNKIEFPLKNKEELLYWFFFKKYYNRKDIISTMIHSRSLNPGEIRE